MNNIQKMHIKTYKAMRRYLLEDIDSCWFDGFRCGIKNRDRRSDLIEIRNDVKNRYKRKKTKYGKKYNNLYEAAKGERDWWTK